jgi:hypothetical protein
MSQIRILPVALAIAIEAIAGLLVASAIQPYSWQSSKHPSPYLHSVGRTTR